MEGRLFLISDNITHILYPFALDEILRNHVSVLMDFNKNKSFPYRSVFIERNLHALLKIVILNVCKDKKK